MTWYKSGLRFECQRSGNCCTGEPGYVWLSREEAADIANLMGIELHEFIDNCTHEIRGKLSLLEFEDGDCIFFDKGCNIYEKRPMQCRTWPFWASNLKSEDTWAEAARNCPGMNKGSLFQFDEIVKQKQVSQDL